MTLQQLLESLLPAVITLGPVVLLVLRNQAQAQAILNRQYENLTQELADTKKQLAETKEQFAYERGVLNERVAGLERMLQDERRDAEERHRENVQRIATLETQKADLIEQLRRKTDECDGLHKRLQEFERPTQPA